MIRMKSLSEKIYLITEDESSEIAVAFTNQRLADRHAEELRAQGYRVEPKQISLYDAMPTGIGYWSFETVIDTDSNLVKRTDVAKKTHWSYEAPRSFGTSVFKGKQTTHIASYGRDYERTREEHEEHIHGQGAIAL